MRAERKAGRLYYKLELLVISLIEALRSGDWGSATAGEDERQLKACEIAAVDWVFCQFDSNDHSTHYWLRCLL